MEPVAFNSDPWSGNEPPFNSTHSLRTKNFPVVPVVQDPLRCFAEEKEKADNDALKLEKLFGEAWSEVPEQMLSELSMALEKDQLDHEGPKKSEPKSIKVLIHWVRQEDTIPGISLKYGISTEFLRRFNRLWPSDRRPFRPFLFIPISLASKLKGLSKEYPDLFYEVKASSIKKVLDTRSSPQTEPAPARNSYHSEEHYDAASNHSSGSLSPDLNNSFTPRPILVIPNCHLKYFPPSSKPKSTNLKDLSCSKKCDLQLQNSKFNTLKPLFSSGVFRPLHGQELPDEIETQILTRGLVAPINIPKATHNGRKVGASPKASSWDFSYKDSYFNTIFQKSDLPKKLLPTEPIHSQDDLEFEMTLLSRPSTPPVI